jgi:hypothetical protein
VSNAAGIEPAADLRPTPGGSLQDDVRTVVMTKKGGKKYRCYLPKEPSTASPETEKEDAPPPHMANYLSSLIGTCFYRLEVRRRARRSARVGRRLSLW